MTREMWSAWQIMLACLRIYPTRISAAELSAVEKKLVIEIQKNNKISQPALAEKLQISRRTVQRLKKQLISKGVLLDSMKKEWVFLISPETLAGIVREKE